MDNKNKILNELRTDIYELAILYDSVDKRTAMGKKYYRTLRRLKNKYKRINGSFDWNVDVFPYFD